VRIAPAWKRGLPESVLGYCGAKSVNFALAGGKEIPFMRPKRFPKMDPGSIFPALFYGPVMRFIKNSWIYKSGFCPVKIALT